MLLSLTCNYCGRKENKEFYSLGAAKKEWCSWCKSGGLVVKEANHDMIDQYEFDPPFPVKEEVSINTKEDVISYPYVQEKEEDDNNYDSYL